MVRDMTEGHPLKRILAFSAPLLLGNLFQQFYSMADSIIVGQYIGVNAFAAVGSTGSINFLILGFVQGACMASPSLWRRNSARGICAPCGAAWPTRRIYPCWWPSR